MEGVLIVFMTVFALPVTVVGLALHYKHKAKMLKAGVSAEPDQKLLQRCEELEARVQTLETIVCEGDLEAATRMRALGASGKRALPPGPAPTDAAKGPEKP
jgi:hypothetical protein